MDHKVSLVLLIKPDSVNRIENFFVILKFLTSNFKFKIVVYFFSKSGYCFFQPFISHLCEVVVFKDFDDVFYRTHYINLFLKSNKFDFVGIWDVDVIVDPVQVSKSLDILFSKKYQFVYPYTGPFYDVSYSIRDLYLSNLDFSILPLYENLYTKLFEPVPLGGVYFASRQAYISIGSENSEFYGWGLEDGYRYKKMLEYGFSVYRVDGPLYHLTHPVSNSSRFHSDFSLFYKSIHLSL